MEPGERYAMKVIARMKSGFASKFGVPRQSGLVKELRGRIIFEPPYRNRDAVRGLEGFSHIWLIWGFDRVKRTDSAKAGAISAREDWSPTVRPPRLGGNQRLGVFATRSPFRPNPIGLSAVELERVEADSPEGPVVHVRGADLVDGTPIFDIKPYLAYTDAHSEAVSGFAPAAPEAALEVEIAPELLARIPEPERAALTAILAQDPRPRYQHDPERVYGFGFAGYEIRFRVSGARLQVLDVAAP